MDKITRKTAKRKGFRRYFTGNRCVNGHISERLVSNFTCTACLQERTKKWKLDNREYVLLKQREWHNLNAEKEIEYRRNNKARIAETYRKYATENKDKLNSKTSAYRASKIEAVPAWITKDHLDEITAMMEEASLLQRIDGVKRHVDHIYPLRPADGSRGLHVPWNMQILTAEENVRKGNRICQIKNKSR